MITHKVLLIIFIVGAISCTSVPQKFSDKEQKIFFAVGQGQELQVQDALNNGFNPNIQNTAGWTPLMLAAFRGRSNIAEMLISRGAAIDMKDQKNRTALYYAIEGNQPDLVQILLKAGAQVEARDSFNLSPLMVAAHRSPLEIVKLLLEAHADLKATDENRWSPLFFAVSGNTAGVMQALIQAGAAMNETDSDGNTVGHICAERGDLVKLKILVANGLNLQLRNHEGKVIQDIAYEQMRFDISDYLERK